MKKSGGCSEIKKKKCNTAAIENEELQHKRRICHEVTGKVINV